MSREEFFMQLIEPLDELQSYQTSRLKTHGGQNKITQRIMTTISMLQQLLETQRLEFARGIIECLDCMIVDDESFSDLMLDVRCKLKKIIKNQEKSSRSAQLMGAVAEEETPVDIEPQLPVSNSQGARFSFAASEYDADTEAETESDDEMKTSFV